MQRTSLFAAALLVTCALGCTTTATTNEPTASADAVVEEAVTLGALHGARTDLLGTLAVPVALDNSYGGRLWFFRSANPTAQNNGTRMWLVSESFDGKDAWVYRIAGLPVRTVDRVYTQSNTVVIDTKRDDILQSGSVLRDQPYTLRITYRVDDSMAKIRPQLNVSDTEGRFDDVWMPTGDADAQILAPIQGVKTAKQGGLEATLYTVGSGAESSKELYLSFNRGKLAGDVGTVATFDLGLEVTAASELAFRAPGRLAVGTASWAGDDLVRGQYEVTFDEYDVGEQVTLTWQTP